MEKFDLKKFNTGDYDVVTRSGLSARILCTDRKVETFKLVVLVSINQIEDILIELTKNGKYYHDGQSSDYDIFLKKKKWVPKEGEMYWYVSSLGEVFRVEHFNSKFDNDMLNFGNCFKTKEEAAMMASKIRQVLNNY